MPCLGNPKFVHNNNLGSKTSWDTLLLADALAILCVVLEGCQEDGDSLVARVVHAQRCGLSLPLQASQDNSQLEVPHTSGKGEIKNMGINHYNLHLRLPISYLFIFFFFSTLHTVLLQKNSFLGGSGVISKVVLFLLFLLLKRKD